MGTALNRQITKLKTQARHAKIKLRIDIKDDIVMLYPKHRSDISGSIGYLNTENKTDLIAYVIDMKRLDWARMEGFSESQLQTENESLNIFKEVRPDAIINHLV